MTLNKFFEIQEFVPPQIYKKYGDRSLWFVDQKIIDIATAYRKYFDLPVTINNWHTGGGFQFRGYRPPRTTFGAEYSQHKFGRAFDCNIGRMSSREMFEEVKANFEYFKQFGLTTLENYQDTPTWLHSDCRETRSPYLLIVDAL